MMLTANISKREMMDLPTRLVWWSPYVGSRDAGDRSTVGRSAGQLEKACGGVGLCGVGFYSLHVPGEAG